MNANHLEIIEQLSAYLDGELTADEATAINNHLDDCADCLAVYERMRRLDMMADNALPDFGDDILDDLQRRIISDIDQLPATVVESKPGQAVITPLWHKYATIAASLLIITLAGRMAVKESDHVLRPELQVPAVKLNRAAESITTDLDDLSDTEKKMDEERQAGSEAPAILNKSGLKPKEVSDLKQKKPLPIMKRSVVGKSKGAMYRSSSVPKGELKEMEMELKVEPRQIQKTVPFKIKTVGQEIVEKSLSGEVVDHGSVKTIGEIQYKETGIVSSDSTAGDMIIRGGRVGETTYLVDGINSSDQLGGSDSAEGFEKELICPMPIDSLNQVYAILFVPVKSAPLGEMESKTNLYADSYESLDLTAGQKSGSVERYATVLDSLGNLDDLSDAENLERLYLTMRGCILAHERINDKRYREKYKATRSQSLDILKQLMVGDKYSDILNDYRRAIESFPNELN